MQPTLQPKEQKRAPVKVIFVCLGNSCRSQMAEALARHLAGDVIEAASAGLTPLGEIAEPVSIVLAERGVHMDGQYSKGLRKEQRAAAELIVNMSGRPSKILFAAERGKVEDWDVSDPYGSDLEMFRQVRDEIEARVADLAERLRRQPAGARKV